ncbi:MAG: citrate lyase acyl carrier protein [Austwickia sp.]|jgi:citrate lyase subunit gamma (acyl carrier protein)|nr:MAG: citrate lyase acyl carrier protein [Austwickia sp.]
MRIEREAVAGTLESSDVMVKVSPRPGSPDGHPTENLKIVITSTVLAQFGDAISAVVKETVDQLGLTHGRVVVEDKGALDCTIRARVQAACLRGSGSPDDVDWNAL